MSQVTVERGDPRHPEATALLEASHALMQEMFAEEDNHYLEISELCVPEIRFFVALVDGKIVGCIALAHKGDYGEVKSLFVDSNARGLGIAQALMQGIEADARAQGLSTLKLETGDTLIAARRLYEQCGFVNCGPFGDYSENGSSVFMTKAL